MEIKTMDEAGINFLINEEGLRLCPYKDTAGIPTIGIGMTYYPGGKRVTMEDKCLSGREEAIELFANIRAHYETAIWSLTRDDITQNQFNALVSLVYNIGVDNFKKSTVLRLINQSQSLYNTAIRPAFEMWKYSEGKPILLPRRKRESDLYFTK